MISISRQIERNFQAMGGSRYFFGGTKEGALFQEEGKKIAGRKNKKGYYNYIIIFGAFWIV